MNNRCLPGDLRSPDAAAPVRNDYIVKQLNDFKAMRRTNDAGNMASVAKTLSDQDIENLAHYISGL